MYYHPSSVGTMVFGINYRTHGPNPRSALLIGEWQQSRTSTHGGKLIRLLVSDH